MTAQPSSIDVSYRNLGAIIGALLALGAIVILYVVTSIPTIESVLLVRTFLSGQDPLRDAVVLPVMVVVPLVSAAVGGWLLSPRAIRGDRWSGVGMGSMSYLVATLIGPLLAYSSTSFTDPVSFFGGSAVVSAFAVFLLFPLLLVCAAFGMLWAALLRRIVPATSVEIPGEARPLPGLMILLGFGVLALGWLPLALLVSGLSSGGSFVD